VLLASVLGAASAAAQTDDPAVVGRWSALKSWPIPAVHTQLLPTGKVMFYPEYDHGDDPRLWDPVTDTLTSLPHAGYNIFCSGHSYLADGKLLITGGHVADYVGLPNASTFDPFTNTWTRLPDMNAGRWYPTNTTLANGDVLVIGGTIDTSSSNLLPQVWETGNQRWRNLTSAQRMMPTYPWMFLAPNNKLFFAGPWAATLYLDTTGTGAWSYLAKSQFGTRDYGSAVMYDDGKILITGGGNPPTNTAEVINLNAPTPAWRSVGSMKMARRQHNSVLMPDGQVLVVGGSYGAGFNNTATPVYQAEMWNPTTEKFTPLSSNVRFRGYHSTAVLLPDGRILFAGGRYEPSMEVYSPPYLFKGARPQIASAPDRVGYGDTFSVQTPDAASIAQVNWIRLNAVTHAFDQNQRINHLSFTKGTGELRVTAPSSPVLCPPGHYQLFILFSNGVPSVSKIIQIGGSAPDRTLAVTAPNGGETLQVGAPYTLRWNTTGSIPTVKLEYSVDRGTSWRSIADSWANGGQYAWTVPDAPTSQGLFRVTSTGTPAVSDVSNAPFAIVGSAPDAGTPGDAGSPDAGVPGPTLLFQDDFTAVSSSGLGSNWNVVSGLWRMDGTRAISDKDAPPPSQATARSGPCLNCHVEADLTPYGVAEAGVFLRAPSTTSADRYDAVLVRTGQVQIRRIRGGVVTVLGTASSGLTLSYQSARLSLSASGTGPVTLAASVNGVQRLTVTDSSADALGSGGYAGLDTTSAGVPYDHFQLWAP